MADTRAFNLYYANRTELPGQVLIEGDELLVLRGSTVYRTAGARSFAYASMHDNAVDTVINTVDVWEPISGVLVQGVTSTSFTYAANQFTYIGVNQASPLIVSAKMTIHNVLGGGASIFEIGIFINGVQIGTGMSCSSDTATTSFMMTDNTHTLQTGDIIDMRIRNTSDVDDVLIVNAQLIIG